MEFRVLQNLVIADGMSYRRAIRCHHDSGYSHHITPRPAGVLNLGDGVAGHTGNAIVVEAAVYLGTFRKGARKQCDGIVTALTVARELDPLCVDKVVHVLEVEGIPERVGVGGLPPLFVNVFMTLS